MTAKAKKAREIRVVMVQIYVASNDSWLSEFCESLQVAV
jgi:hypothetical protein